MTRNTATWQTLRDSIRDDYENYRRDWTKPGFRALAVYRFGVWARELRRDTTYRKLCGRFLDGVYILGMRRVRNHYGIELHRSAVVGKGVKFPHHGGVVIHHYARIGDNCVIQHGVTLGSAGRGVSRDQAPVLEDGVGVGPGAMILGKVTIGEGARIGPNVVVYTDVPAGATLVAGSPRMIFAPKIDKTKNKGSDPDRGVIE